jgi:hypothetical protein
MNIDFDKFNEYMLAKEAYLKINSCGNFGSPKEITLTSEECAALMLQHVFNMQKIMGFVV